jgi:hypothetical protein
VLHRAERRLDVPLSFSQPKTCPSSDQYISHTLCTGLQLPQFVYVSGSKSRQTRASNCHARRRNLVVVVEQLVIAAADIAQRRSPGRRNRWSWAMNASQVVAVEVENTP